LSRFRGKIILDNFGRLNYKTNVRLTISRFRYHDMSKPKNPEKRKEIRRVVARLFAVKGYHGTSMREIGRTLGMNQSSLYHYFSSKEEILFLIMNEAMDEALAVLRDICSSNLSPEEKLDRVLAFYTRYYAGDQDSLSLLVNEMNSLGREYRQVLVEKEREYVKLIRSILEELMRTRKMKDIDPTIATFAFFGMVHYTIKWYRKDGPIGPDRLADHFVKIFTKGILYPP